MAVKPQLNSESFPVKKSKSTWIAFTTLLLLLLIGVGTGARYYLNRRHIPPGEQAATVSALSTPPVPAGQQELGPLVAIDEFIVNIISADANHYLRASMTIEVSDKKTQEELNKRMPQIRDAILLQVSNKTFEELYDLQGKKQLKAELLVRINDILANGSARSLFFTDFVLQ